MKLSVEDALILKEVLEQPKILEAFNSLVKIYCEQNHVDEKEARSIIFPEFALGAIRAVKEK